MKKSPGSGIYILPVVGANIKHGGIDFGTGNWWGGDSYYGLTKTGYFSGDFIDIEVSFTLPYNTYLVSIALSAWQPYSYTISDGVNESISGTTGTQTPEVVLTNWSSGGRMITITTEGGWNVVCLLRVDGTTMTLALVASKTATN